MLVETVTFRLAPGVEEAELLEADHAFQTGFASFQRGFVRRTTARGHDGGWIVITLWWSAEAADAAAATGESDEAVIAFHALVDPATVDRRRYTDIGG